MKKVTNGQEVLAPHPVTREAVRATVAGEPKNGEVRIQYRRGASLTVKLDDLRDISEGPALGAIPGRAGVFAGVPEDEIIEPGDGDGSEGGDESLPPDEPKPVGAVGVKPNPETGATGTPEGGSFTAKEGDTDDKGNSIPAGTTINAVPAANDSPAAGVQTPAPVRKPNAPQSRTSGKGSGKQG